MCVQIQQTVIIGGDHRSDRSICFVLKRQITRADVTDIVGQRPAIHDSTDTWPGETVC